MPGVTVLEIPQWQGSSSADARRLADGAEALAALLPDFVRVRVEAGSDSGDAALVAVLDDVRSVLRVGDLGRTITLGGDCGVELAPIEAGVHEFGDELAVVWFDAHGDLNTAASSPSGAFHGMVLQSLLGGEVPQGLSVLPGSVLDPSRVVLAGVRALDPAESAFIAEAGVRGVTVEELADPAVLVEAVRGTGASCVYVHVDLDVLDPAVFASVGCPEPGGLSPAALVAAVNSLADRFGVVGLGITECQPGRASDLDVLAELVPRLAAAVR